MAETFEGGCACKAVRYRMSSRPMYVHCCHCRDCQRQTGSAFVINALIEADRVDLLQGKTAGIGVRNRFRPAARHPPLPCMLHCDLEHLWGRETLAFRSRRHIGRAHRIRAGRSHLHSFETALGGTADRSQGLRGLLRL